MQGVEHLMKKTPKGRADLLKVRKAFRLIQVLTLSLGLNLIVCSFAFCNEEKNVYIDSDGLISALSKSGILVRYDGDMMIKASSIGLASSGVVEGIALISASELTDCQQKLASKVAAQYLENKDFRKK